MQTALFPSWCGTDPQGHHFLRDVIFIKEQFGISVPGILAIVPEHKGKRGGHGTYLQFPFSSSWNAVFTMTVSAPKLFSFLQLNAVEVKMVDEIDDHIIRKLLGFTIPLCREFAIQCQAFSQCRTSPRERDEFFQAFVGNGWIAKSAKIATRSINDHPDLPQVRFWMFDDSPRYFTETTRRRILLWHEWLETIRIVSLGFWPSLDLLQGLFKRVGIFWTGRVETGLPESQHVICRSRRALKRETRIASRKHLRVLSKKELCCSRSKLHVLDDWKHFLLCTMNVHNKFFRFHLDSSWA